MCDSIINVNSRVFIADMLYLRPNDDNNNNDNDNGDNNKLTIKSRKGRNPHKRTSWKLVGN